MPRPDRDTLLAGSRFKFRSDPCISANSEYNLKSGLQAIDFPELVVVASMQNVCKKDLTMLTASMNSLGQSADMALK